MAVQVGQRLEAFIGGPVIQLLTGLGKIGHDTPRTLKGDGLKKVQSRQCAVAVGGLSKNCPGVVVG